MATKKISELVAADALGDTDLLPVVQAGVSKKATVEQMRAAVFTPFLLRQHYAERIFTASKSGSTVTITSTQPFQVLGKVWQGGQVLASGSVTNGSDHSLLYNSDTKVFSLSSNFNPALPLHLVGGLHIYGNGDLAVNSIWDQGFRPACPNPRGMVYSNLQNKWGDIYLLGVNHITDGTSRYGVTIADGAAPPKIPVIYGGNGSAAYSRMGYFETRDVLDSHGKFMPDIGLFASFANGSALGTSIGSDPVTTGHSVGYRSAVGIEQATGHLWIWSREQSAVDSANTWHDMGTGRGNWYGGYFRTALLGAYWGHGSGSGPDSVNWGSAPTNSSAVIGGRGFSDHLVG